jgi:hypothetical protein
VGSATLLPQAQAEPQRSKYESVNAQGRWSQQKTKSEANYLKINRLNLLTYSLFIRYHAISLAAWRSRACLLAATLTHKGKQ